MNILKLTLKKEWFQMEVDGIKKEEYREITPFFLSRLTNKKGTFRPEVRSEICFFLRHGSEGFGFPDKAEIKRNGIEFVNYDYVEFSNGYGENVPKSMFPVNNIRIGIGKKEWGAPDYPVFIIELGAIKNLSLPESKFKLK
ncbi:MAG: hypothetical protein LBS20_05545 [Prevotella sp.]|nr:hypothetical protein [Prevotella sp.]